MPQNRFTYSPWRDRNLWKYLAVSAAGAIPAVLTIPVTIWVVNLASQIGGGHFLFSVGLLAILSLFAVWAVAWLFVAVRRVLRMRRLCESGVQVHADVTEMRLLRRKHDLVGVALKSQYEVDGLRYPFNRRTTLPGVAARARDLKRVDLVVDPQRPHIAAFVVDGRLG